MAQAFSDRIHADATGERLDVYLTSKGGSRAFWQNAIRQRHILLNRHVATSAQRLKLGDVVDYQPQPVVTKTVSAKLHIPVLYKDDDVIVVNKPAGLVVYPPPGSQQPSLLAQFQSQIEGEEERAGIVHRLDRDTSGVMILARHESAQAYLLRQFKDHHVRKTYIALVNGHLPHDSARIELPVQRRRHDWRSVEVSPHGKLAVLEYKTVRQYSTATLVQVQLLTGRTHQIRVQFSYLGHPVVGDIVYGAKIRPARLQRQFLHAAKLRLRLPSGESKTFSAPLPPELEQYLETLS